MSSFNDVKGYFRQKNTVSTWWDPEHSDSLFGPLLRGQVPLILRLCDVRGKIVLDAGCGQGRFSINFALNGADHVIAVDISQEMLEMLKARAKTLGVDNRLSAIMMDVEHLGFRSDIFDVVCCMETLVHVPDIEAAGKEMFRSLKNDGTAILSITVPVDWLRYIAWIRSLRQLFEWIFTPIYCSNLYGQIANKVFRRIGPIGRPIPKHKLMEVMEKEAATVINEVALGHPKSPRVYVTVARKSRDVEAVET